MTDQPAAPTPGGIPATLAEWVRWLEHTTLTAPDGRQLKGTTILGLIQQRDDLQARIAALQTQLEALEERRFWKAVQAEAATRIFSPDRERIAELEAELAELEGQLAEARTHEQASRRVAYAIGDDLAALQAQLAEAQEILSELIAGPCVRTDTAGVCQYHGYRDCPHAAAREWLKGQEAR